MAFTPIDVDCETGKTGYGTGVDASAAAEWAMSRGMGDRWPYLCRRCGFWHVTSRPPGAPDDVDHHRTPR